MNKEKVVVAIIMGSESDWPTMKHAATILDDFGICLLYTSDAADE